MSDDCLFCKIVAGDIPGDIVYQDELVIAFKDINPQAPVHILIVPKRHVTTLNDLTEDDQSLVGYLILTAKRLAAEQGINESGYRIIMNCNQEGGQTVYHIHMHLMGGRQLTHLG